MILIYVIWNLEPEITVSHLRASRAIETAPEVVSSARGSDRGLDGSDRGLDCDVHNAFLVWSPYKNILYIIII